MVFPRGLSCLVSSPTTAFRPADLGRPCRQGFDGTIAPKPRTVKARYTPITFGTLSVVEAGTRGESAKAVGEGAGRCMKTRPSASFRIRRTGSGTSHGVRRARLRQRERDSSGCRRARTQGATARYCRTAGPTPTRQTQAQRRHETAHNTHPTIQARPRGQVPASDQARTRPLRPRVPTRKQGTRHPDPPSRCSPFSASAS